ncbi:MAG: recombinase family protein [Planctomycetes bacterium]|nr:recombinase family protein [Planctomycetota bacterium]
MNTKLDVIYTRYSTEQQRSESSTDQERRCRNELDKLGIPHEHFEVINDEAVSGTSENRTGFERIMKMMHARQIGTLIVTEQARFSRGDNAKLFIKDVVYYGGRFISVTEGIDTTKNGWQVIAGVMELHHSQSTTDTAARVRGGQEGRVLDGNGSAGDFPFGYRSEYVDPAAALACRNRGPKPKKIVLIDEPSAAVVREIFRRFATGESYGSIVRWLNNPANPVPSIGKSPWHHEHVRRILTNTKYIGIWTYGKTTTVRSSTGKKKQVAPMAYQKVTTSQRPELRIVEQSVWIAVQSRIQELLKIYGMKEGGKKRGPAQHYRLLYAEEILPGLVHCLTCGSRLHTTVSGNGVKRMAWPRIHPRSRWGSSQSRWT